MSRFSPAARLLIRVPVYTFALYAALLGVNAASLNRLVADGGIGPALFDIVLAAAVVAAVLGLPSGSIMGWIAARYYDRVENALQFRLTLALIAALAVLGREILLGRPEWETPMVKVVGAALMAGVLVIASKVAAGQYIRETARRKRKDEL